VRAPIRKQSFYFAEPGWAGNTPKSLWRPGITKYYNRKSANHIGGVLGGQFCYSGARTPLVGCFLAFIKRCIVVTTYPQSSRPRRACGRGDDPGLIGRTNGDTTDATSGPSVRA